MAMAGIYRRVLPSPPAIDFASSEGKQLFMEATQGGTMEGFFKLISYFQTQSEPAYCGLATLAMVLNALSIDPGRKWKGPWRWFDESMLDCCEPLEKVKAEGISFGKVVCLAHCAGAKVEAFRTNQSSIDEFRKHVIACSTSDDRHVISSYNRATFKQTGTGHFSPIGGYHAGRDMALILDVARFKYPPHWVPLKLLWEAMDTLDDANGFRRGFMLISRLQRPPALLYTLVLEFIKWVAEVRRTEEGDQSLSPEEQERLAIKGEILKQVQDTRLYKHVTDFLFSTKSGCHSTLCLGKETSLTDVAASVCCQGAGILKGNSESPNGFCCGETHVHCIKSTGNVPATVVSGTVTNGIGEQHVDMLVPSSAKNLSPSSSGLTSCIGMHPASNDVLTTLLLALPPQTWSGIKDDSLFQEIKSLVSIDNLPTFLQEEIMHLRSQLHFLKRCKDDEVKHQDTSDKAMVFLHGSKSNLHNQGKLSLLGQQRSLGCCSRLADRYERLDRVSGGIKRIITWPKPIAYASIRSIFSVNYLSR
ncbi:glutathione gamma-glutamylcysteinyltransferase 1-like isoform X2 [Cynara cardunculus var. scolymus]|uniref:glutathione gamma-glutamylcysteinyltransferase 1-like isoform X2 n=1 Tax=Cynara cardunculus var. scolymus TaxID=59895 RepID=UPI000D628BA2|nr:glutathione gamma-glutamylcysteinyltransferase 1-like isoform X2 [Cynara cardunculus var. scolymus]